MVYRTDIPRYIKSLSLERWWLILLAISIIAFVFNVLLFYPGYMSTDSLNQLCQAKGDCGLSTWHPVSMALFWRLLITISGKIGAIVIFQIVLLWGSLFLLSNYVWRKTKKKSYSIAVLGIGVLPYVWGLSGVIWKDVHMAYSLLAALSLILTSNLTKKKHQQYPLWLGALLLISYAISVRVNAIAAALPLLYLLLLTYRSGSAHPKVKPFISTVIIAIVISFVGFNFYKVANLNVTKSNASVSMYAYDIVNIYTKEEIRNKAPSNIREGLLELSPCSYRSSPNHTLNLGFWECFNDLGSYFNGDNYTTLKTFWIKTIVGNPVDYLFSKVASASMFLVATPYIAPVGIPSYSEDSHNIYNLSTKLSASSVINQSYVKDFGYRYFPFFFSGWFWLVSGVLILIYSFKTKKNSRLVKILSLSAVMYILPMLAGDLTPDFRYFYWPAIASTLALLFIVLKKKSRISDDSL